MAITSGPLLNSVPAPLQQALVSNYIDFTGAGNDWAQQYLPDLMEKEAEVFGNRTISGFLSQVGAEESMTADQVIWSEQGRLHLSYIAQFNVIATKADGTAGAQIDIQSDIDGNTGTTVYSTNDHGIRVNDVLLIADSNTTAQAVVTAVTAATGIISVDFYGANTGTAAGFLVAPDPIRVLVTGSEYAKGQNGRVGQNEPFFKSFTNKPIILKDKYSISGSDASQIGWVEVSGEDGQNGYMWYLKAEGDTKARFTDYVEMSMIEGVIGVPGSTLADSELFGGAGNTFGTEGLFAAVTSRGNQSNGITVANGAAMNLAEFDLIMAEFDKNGAIEENMMFMNRDSSNAVDDMLAAMNSYGGGGTSYGVFDNSEDMALNLGFSGFRRASYDFYKTDWKYLNDFATRGSINAINTLSPIRGIFIPAGVSSVYDQQMGKNMKRPFLHVRYRASQTDDRRMKSWVTGSVGAVTSELDAMEIHYLSERCLITQGANNFMLLN